jgi:hypothetical protein
MRGSALAYFAIRARVRSTLFLNGSRCMLIGQWTEYNCALDTERAIADDSGSAERFGVVRQQF